MKAFISMKRKISREEFSDVYEGNMKRLLKRWLFRGCEDSLIAFKFGDGKSCKVLVCFVGESSRKATQQTWVASSSHRNYDSSLKLTETSFQRTWRQHDDVCKLNKRRRANERSFSAAAFLVPHDAFEDFYLSIYCQVCLFIIKRIFSQERLLKGQMRSLLLLVSKLNEFLNH